jgi:hypothetical protein
VAPSIISFGAYGNIADAPEVENDSLLAPPVRASDPGNKVFGTGD